MAKRMNNMGIKGKALLGCIVVGVVLFISSIISMFEFGSMNDYVTQVIADNIRSIDASRELLSTAEKHNLSLLYGISGDYSDIESESDAGIVSTFSDLRNTFTNKAEKVAADSVLYAYAAYMQVVREAPAVWESGAFARRDWYFNRLQPIYLKLRDYIQTLNYVSQDALIENSKSLQDNFYRSMMPPMVSFLLGLLLVMLFNYFLNYYIINPLLKVTKGIKGYRMFNKPYNVNLDNEGDELSDLNEAVNDMVDLNHSYKQQIQTLKSKLEKNLQ